MSIVAEDVERVRAAADFVAVASEHIALKRVGRRWQGLCPFHAEKSPSFSINAEEKLFYCFGCHAGGDVFRFVMDVEHLDFKDAVERLASKSGVTLHYDDDSPAAGRERQQRQALLDAMEKAVAWYHERLLTGSDAAAARRYLRERGYDGDAVRAYRMGWAPAAWDELSRHLGVPEAVLIKAGLATTGRRGTPVDKFRARIMFPIFDVGGHPVAFGGRILPGGDGPKYMNSPETPIYAKSRTLYGLNWAKTGVVEAGEVIVCEGYTDVIGFFRAGLPRAVATCGTALADEHFRMLKNFARRVVLAYDADAAGQSAAARFYEWERRYEIDLAVASFPDGADPADVARRDPAALAKAVAEAEPFLAFRLGRVLRGADLRSPEGRAHAAEAAIATVAEHPSDLVRDQYLMQVADRCRIDADRLRPMLAQALRAPAPSSRPGRGDGSGPAASRIDRSSLGDRGDPPDERSGGGDRAPSPSRHGPSGPEVEALRIALHHPEAVADRLEVVLFTDETAVAAFRALASATTLTEALSAADPEASALLGRLAVEEPDAEPSDVVNLLIRRAAERALADLQTESRVSPDRGDELLKLTAWVKVTMEQLPDPDTGIDAGRRLVAWLAERCEEEA